jgi:hypothetical protein
MSFMNLMVASPASLLFRCVREKDFTRARQVIEFFGLASSRESHVVRLVEAADAVRAKFSPNSSASDVMGSS